MPESGKPRFACQEISKCDSPGRSVELLENRPLFGASRAPGCLNENQDRFAALLRRVECSLLVGQDSRGVHRAERSDTHAQGKARNDSESPHGLSPPASGW